MRSSLTSSLTVGPISYVTSPCTNQHTNFVGSLTFADGDGDGDGDDDGDDDDDDGGEWW